MKVNDKITHLNDRAQWEFKCIEKYLIGNGIDIGCGTNRLSPDILALDQQGNKEFSHADIVHDCKDLDIKPKNFNHHDFTFEKDTIDFIFSSHCLEDFENIPEVFSKWWEKIKPGGYMLLLLPDMEKCECETCMKESNVEYRKKIGCSARYWTVEDYKNTGKGNPSHRTNTGLKYINDMLEEMKLDYEMVQSNTLDHGKTCSIDFVIKKLKEAKHG